MANLCPFRALRPRPVDAARIAAVPYDVLDTEEARALAEGNSLSFLRVSRAEIECEPGTDPHAAEVYERARGNFAALRQSALVIEEMPSLYLYRLGMGGHEQIGVAACFALDDYDNDVIKKHEWTRRDKEDDRTRHMLSLGAQTGPVFLIYRARAEINRLVAAAATAEPFIDFEAIDGVRHTLWRLEDCDCDALIKATARIPFLYIADGHHRAASAARARTELQKRAGSRMPFDSIADYRTFLAVAFPDHQVQILPYNRVVRDLAGLSADEFLLAIGARFEVSSGPAMPVRRGDIAMYVHGTWYTLRSRVTSEGADPGRAMDVSVLQNELLAPVLNIGDVRIDTRIEFVGGARGARELERLVDSGRSAVAFSLYPVGATELMAVSDAGAIMPPKSTWFEPKLRDGLLIHVI